jgi:hypothetical protein
VNVFHQLGYYIALERGHRIGTPELHFEVSLMLNTASLRKEHLENTGDIKQ